MAGQNNGGNRMLIGSAFALGLGTGLLLKGIAQRLFEPARGRRWRRQVERTVTYDNNLPDQLERREPAPWPGQPRFGGTGAIGVPSAAASSSVGRAAEGE
jgi:hypothetical protein